MINSHIGMQQSHPLLGTLFKPAHPIGPDDITLQLLNSLQDKDQGSDATHSSLKPTLMVT